MRVKIYFIAIAILVGHMLFAQSSNKITGPLGIYHIAAGHCYNDSTDNDSTIIQYQFRFGELAMPNQLLDNGFNFQAELDSCTQWNANRVLGIIQPPTEHGVYNQPLDTALYTPYAQLNGPGMIQGGQRFSKLSQLYGGYSGVILDDWNGDTSITRQVRDAVQGKYVDETGSVHSECVATTPYNKLYCVIYGTGADPAALPVIDGVSYWYYRGQNCCYTNLDADITQLRAGYPKKEIMIGIYLKNTYLGWTDPASVQYMLAHAIDRYDDGDINGITLFAGLYLLKDQMPLNEWNAFALPRWLDSLYYPYLGAGEGLIRDCTTGNTLTGASVHVFCKGRASGDTLMRSSQKTDASGRYDFGLWAGNRTTDSTYYGLIAEKSGYITDTVGFWIKRNDTTYIPGISLCPAPDSDGSGSQFNMLVFPNPTHGKFVIKAEEIEAIGGELEVYNMLGEKVYSTTQCHPYLHVDLSGQPDGVYLVLIRTANHKNIQKRLLVVQH